MIIIIAIILMITMMMIIYARRSSGDLQTYAETQMEQVGPNNNVHNNDNNIHTIDNNDNDNDNNNDNNPRLWLISIIGYYSYGLQTINNSLAVTTTQLLSLILPIGWLRWGVCINQRWGLTIIMRILILILIIKTILLLIIIMMIIIMNCATLHETSPCRPPKVEANLAGLIVALRPDRMNKVLAACDASVCRRVVGLER